MEGRRNAMRNMMAKFRRGFYPLAAVAAVLTAMALSGCGQSAPGKKETDPAKIEAKRAKDAEQSKREWENK